MDNSNKKSFSIDPRNPPPKTLQYRRHTPPSEAVAEDLTELPADVVANLAEQKALFEEDASTIDPAYERLISTLMQVQVEIDEEVKVRDRYLFDQAAFIDALGHVVADQKSALKKEKITAPVWAERFNRWFVFCDAVLNLGISCSYSKELMNKENYAEIFGTLKLNAIFDTTFLKPRGIKVIFTHKNPVVRDKYPWLAMPVLVVKDDAGVEQHIALTPSPNAAVWWLDVLTGFHGTFEWHKTVEEEQDSFDEAPHPRIEDYKGE